MIREQHYKRLLKNYAAAPANIDRVTDMSVSSGKAQVTIDIRDEDRDAAGVIDRALYFKVLSDAAQLAANSLVDDRYVMPEFFNMYVTWPIVKGPITAEAQVISARDTVFTIEAYLVDSDGNRLAHGHGVFGRSAVELAEEAPTPFEAESEKDEADEADIELIVPQVVWQTPFGRIFPN